MSTPQFVANRYGRIAAAAAALVIALVLTAALAAGSAGGASGGAAMGDGGAKSGGKGGKIAKVDARYERLWNKVSRRNKKWARSTAQCESGRNAKAIGGGGIYRGAFQFMKSTWKNSPKSPGGDPIRYAYKTQAVVAVALKKRDSAAHWPVCG